MSEEKIKFGCALDPKSKFYNPLAFLCGPPIFVSGPESYRAYRKLMDYAAGTGEKLSKEEIDAQWQIISDDIPKRIDRLKGEEGTGA